MQTAFEQMLEEAKKTREEMDMVKCEKVVAVEERNQKNDEKDISVDEKSQQTPDLCHVSTLKEEVVLERQAETHNQQEMQQLQEETLTDEFSSNNGPVQVILQPCDEENFVAVFIGDRFALAIIDEQFVRINELRDTFLQGSCNIIDDFENGSLDAQDEAIKRRVECLVERPVVWHSKDQAKYNELWELARQIDDKQYLQAELEEMISHDTQNILPQDSSEEHREGDNTELQSNNENGLLIEDDKQQDNSDGEVPYEQLDEQFEEEQEELD